MLDFHNILWVIPGVIFIYLYNRRRPYKAINLSGWPYIFFLVVLASFTYLPAEWITTQYITPLFFKKELPQNLPAVAERITAQFIGTEYLLQQAIILLISISISVILFLFTQIQIVAKRLSIAVQDNFYKKCVEWENKEILLTLKNAKAYIGILWKYPESPKSRHQSQTISIVPFKSGYRKKETKEIVWNIYYPQYTEDTELTEMEIIIPRSEIITFGKFNRKAFEYFEKQVS